MYRNSGTDNVRAQFLEWYKKHVITQQQPVNISEMYLFSCERKWTIGLQSKLILL